MDISQSIKRQIVAAGSKLYQAGFAPANSGNYSMRLDDGNIAITVSGADKGQLTEEDIILINPTGEVLHSSKKSSAETLLHTSLYELFPEAGAVLHTHSSSATVLSCWHKSQSCIFLADYELQKIFPKIETHESTVAIPLFPNTQDMKALSNQVKKTLPHYENVPAYLIVGHGLYTWGKTMQDALRYIEALEFLFQCELELLKINSKQL
jgi:methylthioribulose-1-phosphate dehydratase